MSEQAGYINFHTHHLHGPEQKSLYNYIVKNGEEAIPTQIFSAGIHPWFITNLPAQQKLLEKISTEKNCIVIGEAGLDHECQTPLDIQQEAFIFQCKLALAQGKPMVLHVVKSHFESIKLLKEQGVQKAVFHGYNNRYTILEKVLETSFLVSIGAAVMNERSPAAALIKEIPAEKLLLETDESHFTIEEIYAAVAQKRNMPVEALQEQCSQNFKHLLSI